MGKSKDWNFRIVTFFFFFFLKRRTDTNSAIPRGACFSVIVEYFRNKYRDNLAFYFKEKIYGS